MEQLKYSVILSSLGGCTDRFLTSGYGRKYSVEELFERAGGIKGIKGVELVSNWHINTDTQNEVKTFLKKHKLELVSIIPDHFGKDKWGAGAFSSKDAGIRREAVDITKELMDVAVNLNCDLINLWPGQDGYDYMFTADYIKERSWLEEGIAECCAYNEEVRVAIEYKIKEPRVRSYPSNVATTLLMVKEIGANNCGVTIDYGHAYVAYENAAESVAMLKKYGNKLYHVHINDNLSLWDDDMIAGSVHTIPFIEFLFWLKRTQYKGYISMDQYPYREDGKCAVEESIRWLTALNKVMERIPENEIDKLFISGNATDASRMLRKYMLCM